MFLFEWLLPINCILVYALIRLVSQRRAEKRRAAGGAVSGVMNSGGASCTGSSRGAVDRDLALGVTICLLTLGVLGSTEVLSIFHAISRRSLILFWGGLDVLLVLGILLLLVGMIRQGQVRPIATVRSISSRARGHWPSAVGTLVLLSVMFCLGVVAVRLAWETVPYNWDSMTYHLGRVAHWYQNGSVAHYASNIDRQILSPTLGEFLILQVYTLAGGSDRSVNLVQCAAYLLCAILVVRLARRLGARHWMACLSGVLFMTMPIAFAESLTTQNDLVSAVYLLVYVTMAMELWQQETPIRLTWNSSISNANADASVREETVDGSVSETAAHNLLQILCMGLCIGYGYLVKPSVCLGMVIFLIPVLAGCWRRRDSIGVVIASMLVAGVMAAAVAAPELARMYGTYHAFSNSRAGARQMVGSLDPRMLLLNFCKSLAFNLPNGLMPGLPDGIVSFLYGLAAVFGVNLDDPAIAEDGHAYGLNAANDYAHDTAVNAGIFWLWLVCLLFLLVTLIVRCVRRQQDLTSMRAAHVYIGTTIVAFVLFWFVVRWEPYEVRYMLPYLALMCVAAPLALQLGLTRLLPEGRIRMTEGILAALALIVLVPTLLTMREVVDYHQNVAAQQGDRPDGYYYYRGGELGAQWSLCEAVMNAGYTTVGAYCGGDDYEYPLWYWLGDTTVIEHVLVDNETAQYEDASYTPDCILFLGKELPAEYDSQGYLSYHGARYTVADSYDDSHLILVRE